jgi:hypothetical protein
MSVSPKYRSAIFSPDLGAEIGVIERHVKTQSLRAESPDAGSCQPLQNSRCASSLRPGELIHQFLSALRYQIGYILLLLDHLQDATRTQLGALTRIISPSLGLGSRNPVLAFFVTK